MKKLKNLLLKWLGIDSILLRLNRIDNTLHSYYKQYRIYEQNLHSVAQDNTIILKHLDFINSNFFAAADISGSNSDFSTNTIIIVRKNTHGKDEISYYEIQTRDVNQVMDIIRGFGRKNTALDTPFPFPINPKFRY